MVPDAEGCQERLAVQGMPPARPCAACQKCLLCLACFAIGTIVSGCGGGGGGSPSPPVMPTPTSTPTPMGPLLCDKKPAPTSLEEIHSIANDSSLDRAGVVAGEGFQNIITLDRAPAFQLVAAPTPAPPDPDEEREKEEKAEKETWEKRAKTGADFVKDLSTAIHDIVKKGSVNVKNVLSIVESFAKVIPVVGPFIGAILAAVNLFIPGEADPVMQKLNQMKSQLDDIQTQLSEWFNKVLDQVKLSQCKTEYFDAESKLVQAYDALLEYRHNPSGSNKLNFLGACEAGMVCDQKLKEILKALNGDTGLMGCDLLMEIYKGTDTGFVKGSTKYFSARSMYLLWLATIGMTVETAFETLRNGGGTCAYKDVQARYRAMLTSASWRAHQLMTQAAEDAPKNMGDAAAGYVSRGGSSDIETVSLQITQVLKDNFPDYNIYTFSTHDDPTMYPEQREEVSWMKKYTKHILHQNGKSMDVYFVPMDGRFKCVKPDTLNRSESLGSSEESCLNNGASACIAAVLKSRPAFHRNFTGKGCWRVSSDCVHVNFNHDCTYFSSLHMFWQPAQRIASPAGAEDHHLHPNIGVLLEHVGDVVQAIQV